MFNFEQVNYRKVTDDIADLSTLVISVRHCYVKAEFLLSRPYAYNICICVENYACSCKSAFLCHCQYLIPLVIAKHIVVLLKIHAYAVCIVHNRHRRCFGNSFQPVKPVFLCSIELLAVLVFFTVYHDIPESNCKRLWFFCAIVKLFKLIDHDRDTCEVRHKHINSYAYGILAGSSYKSKIIKRKRLCVILLAGHLSAYFICLFLCIATVHSPEIIKCCHRLFVFLCRALCTAF